ncbi:MAG: alpha/beta hydrolase [Chloroflexota bacterium]
MLTTLTDRWISDDLTINGRTIHYTRTGGDKPPLLLVHGFTDGGLMWAKLARDLEDQFDVLMPDAYGHGTSTRADAPISLDDMADDLIGALELLDLSNLIVLGFSMGASVTALAAAQRPDLFKAIILEDAPWYAGERPDAATGVNWEEWYQWLESVQKQSKDEAMVQAQKENPDWDLLDIETYIDSRQQVDLQIFGHFPIGFAQKLLPPTSRATTG